MSEIKLTKKELKQDASKNNMLAFLIYSDGKWLEKGEKKPCSRLTGVKTKELVFDWHRSLNLGNRELEYVKHSDTPGRFLRIYNKTDTGKELFRQYAIRLN